MRKFKAVIFDLDDTLYPEMDYVISGFKVVSQYVSTKINMESHKVFDSLLKLFEEDRINVFNRLLESYDVDKGVVKECVNLYRNHYPNIRLTEEVQELLQLLKEKGLKIGIITDGRPEGQWNKIKALGLEKYCDSIIVTDELGGIEYRKPNEIPYKKILQELGVEAKEAVYIGDNPAKDFITANKLGMFTIMFKNNKGLYQQTNLSNEYLARTTINKIFEVKELIKST
ncbi:MAG: superfamily hydrolase [Clostridia bacterium]|jgi:putative hydrolase of the HAD superfamily|nr:superfamily hydrolase [Clostridia bacterium]